GRATQKAALAGNRVLVDRQRRLDPQRTAVLVHGSIELRLYDVVKDETGQLLAVGDELREGVVEVREQTTVLRRSGTKHDLLGGRVDVVLLRLDTRAGERKVVDRTGERTSGGPPCPGHNAVLVIPGGLATEGQGDCPPESERRHR